MTPANEDDRRAIQAEEPSPPWEQPGCFRLDCEPHRGRLLWWMAVVSVSFSVVMGGVALLVVLALPLSGATWYLARQDLKQMDKGRMDPSGRRLTRSARAASFVALMFTALYGLYILFSILERIGK